MSAQDGLVVDLGCGDGEWVDLLAAEGCSTCGVDASPSMIEAARKNSRNERRAALSWSDHS